MTTNTAVADPTVAWTSIREDIASLHLAAESFEAMPSEHKPELIELMRLSTTRLTKRLGEMERSLCPDEETPATSEPAYSSPNAVLEETQKKIRRNRAKRTTPRGVNEVAIMTDTERYEGSVINESDTGMGITIAIPSAPPISNGQNIRVIRNRRLRLARIIRTTKDANGRFEIGAKWL